MTPVPGGGSVRSRPDEVPVAKFHGTGNDFVVIDADLPVQDRRSFAEAYCDRETGIAPPEADGGAAADRGTGEGIDTGDDRGADGVLFCAMEPEFRPPRVVMTLVQPDGSTAAMCGNGARCAAAWAMDRTGSDAVMIDTLAGTRRAELVAPDDAAEGNVAATSGHGDDATDAAVADRHVAVEMGDPSFDPEVVPLDRDAPLVAEPLDDLVVGDWEGYAVTGVRTGVPHAVVFVDDVEAVPLEDLAPPLRHADVFPDGANVTVASRDEGADGVRFRQRTYERGVEGETDSCGTGAVAVAAAADRLGRLDGATVRVSPPGGDLAVELPEEGPPVLRGPVVREFDADVPIDPGEPAAGREGT